MNPYFDPFFPALLAGVFLLSYVSTRRSRRMRWALLSLVGLVWVYSSVWPSLLVDRLLERKYESAKDASNHAAAAIVVLAGDGVTPNAYQQRTLLGEHTLVRLEKAYDLAVQRPELRVITTGGILFGADHSVTLGDMMRTWLNEKGIAAERIVADEASGNTHASARNVAKLACAGGEAVFLVTEAVHMPRAAAAFAAQGCEPIPIPCSLKHAEGLDTYYFFPSGDGLARTQGMIHEAGGILWYWLSGRFAKGGGTS